MTEIHNNKMHYKIEEHNTLIVSDPNCTESRVLQASKQMLLQFTFQHDSPLPISKTGDL